MSVVSCGVSPGLRVPHFVAPEAKALDVDRTLTQVPVSTERVLAVSEEFGLTRNEITAAQRDPGNHDGDRDPLRYVQNKLSEADFLEWCQLYIDRRDPPLTYPDTSALLEALLRTPEIPHTGVTYGANFLLQVIKIAGAGCRLYTEILNHTDKGPHLATWWDGDTADFIGRNADGEPVAVYHARSVDIVDDSDVSLANLPGNCTGSRLVRPGEKRKPGQEGPVPEHLRDRVRTVAGLGEVALLRGLAYATCSTGDFTVIEDPTRRPVSFAPAYPRGNGYPGMLITPDIPFKTLKATAESLYA